LFVRSKLLLKLTAWIAALKTLGGWGVLILAAIDSFAIPIPLDPLVAGYVYSDPPKAWLYCIAAAVGSAVGSLAPYLLGRAGGELFLLKRINEARLKNIRDRFEKHEFFALMIPAMLPPPTPFKLFVFSAGVFEMKVVWFLLSITAGRLARFAILATLTIIFGPQIVAKTKDLFLHHLWFTALVIVFAGVVLYFIFRMLRAPAEEVRKEIHREQKDHS
jgi:membrane protein YqaA with SNARE-associated domain